MIRGSLRAPRDVTSGGSKAMAGSERRVSGEAYGAIWGGYGGSEVVYGAMWGSGGAYGAMWGAYGGSGGAYGAMWGS